MEQGHGGWSPNDDIIETRGILYDDNISGNRGLTIKNCVKGINDTGVRLKILLSDACNMHMLENIFDYSTEPSPPPSIARQTIPSSEHGRIMLALASS